MSSDKNHCYAPKLDRLLRIRAIDSLRDLVPPTFPIAALPTAVTGEGAPVGDAISAYAASLGEAFPRLTLDVEEACGPAPWIVRSAGIEDLADYVNAGGYDSLVCLAPEDLIERIATVALSGSTEHARRQLELSGRASHFGPVSCFVQPLLNIDVAGDVRVDHSPYLDSAVLDRMEAVCSELMEVFGFSAIDCEWGLDTTLGFVSVTTIMPRDRGVMNVAHTIGFGFASAQSAGSVATSLALTPACTDLRLWRGRHLRQTTVRRLHLLQARPAHCDAAYRERAALTDDCYEALSRHYDVLKAGLLTLGVKSSGRALAAPDLMSAWRQYLSLDMRKRAAVSVVLVDEGSAEEHAGIMFRQQKITCVKTDTRRVPASADGDYRRYLMLMQQWIALLSKGPLSLCDDAVLRRFQNWLQQWLGEGMRNSFEIEDRNWRSEFDAIAAARESALRYENPHVLHNLLHQWTLASLRADTQSLPKRVQVLERFCSTFSSRATKVLRFERELLEIQIPMGTHKASYVFTPRQITVEWTEPPDCPGSEIARILAFEVFLDRFRTWMFPGVAVRRARVLGTWTLFIRLGVPGRDPWRYDDLTRFVAATRFLFDASYDFSYVRNGAVDGFAQRFNGPDWESVVATLVRYRTVFDDASQYVALHVLPMSSTVSAIAQSRVVRGLILRCLHGGIDRCWALIDKYAQWLASCARGDDRWCDRYEYLRQASLFVAARWPREALTRLTRRKSFHIGHDLIAACLCMRSDIQGELLQVVAAGGSTLSGIYALIARHAPEIAVTRCGAAPFAALLADTGVRFRRAKHFLVAHFGDQIEPSVLGRLLHGMDTVPWGRNAAAEQAIQGHISTRGFICRFELERGVDWTTLDSRSTTRMPLVPR